MKNLLFKSLLLVGLLGAVKLQASNDIVATYTTNEVRLLGTNPAYVASVTISAAANSVIFDLFDSSTAVTNFVTSAYVTRQTIVSNVVTSYVTTTGITNNLTNTVLYTTTITNAANTNALPYHSFALNANQTFTFDANSVMAKGIVGRLTNNGTNTTGATITLHYRNTFQ